MTISRFKLLTIILATLLAGALLTSAVWIFTGAADNDESDQSADTDNVGGDDSDHAHADGDGDTYYTCPMHPSVISDSPGACPVCGMDLIKKTSSGGEMNPAELAALGQVAISPTQRVLANVQTSTVRSVIDAKDQADTPADSAQVRATGIVAADEAGLATVPSWLDGRVERLLVKKIGSKISRGQPILEIYSPELLTAQNEFLIALQNADATPGSATASLVEPTRQRLRLLGMSDAQIDALEESRAPRQSVTMRAPNAGTITDLLVRQGQYVQTGTPLFEVADLSALRIEADLRAHALAEFDLGATAHISSDAWSGEPLKGEVEFIYPTVQADTRTVKVRVKLDKPDAKLKPGMFVTVFIDKRSENSAAKPAAEHDSHAASADPLLIPRSAVIRGGKVDHVYVEVSENLFEKRQVQLGGRKDRYLIALDGLKAGDTVATSGAFLLDSEVQLHTFGADEHDHDEHAHHDHDEHDHDEHGHDDGPMLSPEDVPAEGEEFDPPISVERLPEDVWFCDMGGKAHWAQGEKGDGKCPLCGMFLVEHEHGEGAGSEAGEHSEHDHDSEAK